MFHRDGGPPRLIYAPRCRPGRVPTFPRRSGSRRSRRTRFGYLFPGHTAVRSLYRTVRNMRGSWGCASLIRMYRRTDQLMCVALGRGVRQGGLRELEDAHRHGFTFRSRGVQLQLCGADPPSCVLLKSIGRNPVAIPHVPTIGHMELSQWRTISLFPSLRSNS